MKTRRKLMLGFLFVILFLAVGLQLPAIAATGGRAAGATSGLFERQPQKFTYKTIERLPGWVASLPEEVSHAVVRRWRRGLELDATGVALMFILLAALIYGIYGRRRFALRVQSSLVPLTRQLPWGAAPWLSACAEVIAAALLPLSLWVLYLFVAALTNYPEIPFRILGVVLMAWTEYAVAASLIHELVIKPLLDIPPDYGRYVFRFSRGLLIYGLSLWVALDAATKLDAPADMVALFRFLFELSLILLLGIFFARRRAIMALFPDIPNRIYKRFVSGLDRIYPLALILTLGTALLEWAGFTRLADFVWIRTWALVGLFVLAVLLHHFLRKSLHYWIVGQQAASETATSFYRSGSRLLDYIGFIAVVLIALHLTGLGPPLGRLLGAQFATVGGHPLSALTLIEAVAIVAGFFFTARLLRDYLNFRIYPALQVDEGVAHAIDTFLIYALTITGALAALEAVGLGLGTIALFAGALGVGVGFGLQSMTNNLASGLTLIFSRAMRRGDWVTVGETIGMVQQIGVRTTRMRTRDDIEYVVPNSEFVDGKIVNWTRSNPHARLHIPIGVSYGADPEEVRRILEAVAKEHPRVQADPSPEVWFVGFGDSSLNFELLVWVNVKEESRHRLSSDLYFAIFRAFKAAGIEIPFPQRDIHIRSADGLAGLRYRPG